MQQGRVRESIFSSPVALVQSVLSREPELQVHAKNNMQQTKDIRDTTLGRERIHVRAERRMAYVSVML